MVKGTVDNFKQEVLEAKGKVLVDFWATWCGPCRMIAPILEEIDQEHPEVKIVKVDVDEQMPLAMEYKVTGIPMLLVFENGERKAAAMGAQPKEKILELLEV